jgi:phosphoglucosamine mutase
LIGADTRESGGLDRGNGGRRAGQAGARSALRGRGHHSGVAYLTRSGRSSAGVMISASHNPYQDNGLKVFGHNGFKLPDEEEAIVEQEILRLRESGSLRNRRLSNPTASGRGNISISWLSLATMRLDGVKLAMDCGNGAAYRLGPELFAGWARKSPRCASNPTAAISICIAARFTSKGCRRRWCVPAPISGWLSTATPTAPSWWQRAAKVVDGDSVLLVLARAMKAAGHLKEDTVVATVMSNLGLEKALESAGIRMVRMPVGDKYVLEEMVRLGASLGGEQSGHVILREFATTGDGMLTALRTIETARAAGTGLDELTADLRVYPQKLVNVRVREKKSLTDVPSVAREIEHVETAFAGKGRVLVRFSGTEPLARVMVEGLDAQQVESFSARIADAIRLAMGALGESPIK